MIAVLLRAQSYRGTFHFQCVKNAEPETRASAVILRLRRLLRVV